MDFQDVMSGVDACIALGVADPERLGISGLSYGGYLAGWAVTQTDRFGAAVAMSVVSNYVSFHLTSEVWMYDEMILEGGWNDPTSQYVERSPVTHAHRCRTPTLVIHGGHDYRVPENNGIELFNILQNKGIKSRFIHYPDENHWILSPQNSIHWNWEVQSWLSRYIGGTPTLVKPVFESVGEK